MYQHIVVAVDDSACSAHTLVEAMRFARATGASLTLVEFADHSFHAPAKSGRKDPEVLAEALDACVDWMAENWVRSLPE